MSDPTPKTTSSPQFYSPPVEAQRELMAKAHSVKRPGDLCLGVVKQGGNELLVYSKDDTAGACHVGGLKGERVGYVSASEVQNFIAKYSPKPKTVPAAKAVTNLVASVKTLNLDSIMEFVEIREIYHPILRGEIFFQEKKLNKEFSQLLFSAPFIGLCEYLKDSKKLSKEEKKIVEKNCSKKTPVKKFNEARPMAPRSSFQY